MTVTKSEGLSEKLQIAIVAVLSIGVCALLFYFHTVRETSAVVTHFFYIPIILAALWWREKGLFVASVIYYSPAAIVLTIVKYTIVNL